MSNNPDISDQIYAECVNSWRNMHLGLFYAQLPNLISNKSILVLVKNFEFPIINSNYELDKRMLLSLLRSPEPEQNGLNSFSFLLLSTCFGNIFRAFKEGIDKAPEFRSFIKQTLKTDYHNTKELVYFLRNFFSHNIDQQFKIHSDDISAKRYKTLKINLKLSSKKLDLDGPEINICTNLDFTQIESGKSLTRFMRFDEILIFADLCARLALDFDFYRMNKSLKEIKLKNQTTK